MAKLKHFDTEQDVLNYIASEFVATLEDDYRHERTADMRDKIHDVKAVADRLTILPTPAPTNVLKQLRNANAQLQYLTPERFDDDEHEANWNRMLKGLERAILQESIRIASDGKRDEFIGMIARMKTEEEYEDGDAPSSEDWICTLSELIVEARKIQKGR